MRKTTYRTVTSPPRPLATETDYEQPHITSMKRNTKKVKAFMDISENPVSTINAGAIARLIFAIAVLVICIILIAAFVVVISSI